MVTLAADLRRFLGPVHPAAAIAATVVLGPASVAVLRSRDWGRVDILDWSTRGAAGAVVAAFGFAFVAIVADRTIGFADDINVPWPNAFVFYPAIAIVAEVVLHLVPLALLTLLFRLRFEGDAGAAVIACMVAVALVETTYQVAASRRAGARLALVVFVGVHLAVIGFAQMVMLWRFGVASMLVFRLVYYACWHVVWGRLRLAP